MFKGNESPQRGSSGARALDTPRRVSICGVCRLSSPYKGHAVTTATAERRSSQPKGERQRRRRRRLLGRQLVRTPSSARVGRASAAATDALHPTQIRHRCHRCYAQASAPGRRILGVRRPHPERDSRGRAPLVVVAVQGRLCRPDGWPGTESAWRGTGRIRRVESGNAGGVRPDGCCCATEGSQARRLVDTDSASLLDSFSSPAGGPSLPATPAKPLVPFSARPMRLTVQESLNPELPLPTSDQVLSTRQRVALQANADPKDYAYRIAFERAMERSEGACGPPSPCADSFPN